MKKSQKFVALLLALVLLVGCAVGATIAYLQTKTNEIVNTFTSSDVSITLTETGATNNAQDFKMIPGATIDKDPKVTVVAGSEACYVFVKVDAVNTAGYITYTMAGGWTQLENDQGEAVEGVYYRVVNAEDAASGAAYDILANNQVQVLPTVTKAMMETAKTTQPTLSFTAYAIQLNHLADSSQNDVVDAYDAWQLISK